MRNTHSETWEAAMDENFGSLEESKIQEHSGENYDAACIQARSMFNSLARRVGVEAAKMAFQEVSM